MPKHFDVVGAVLLRNGTVLCTQRGGSGPLAGSWEFPGGKVEQGESPSAALIREIQEELGCTISVGDRVVSTTHEYDFATVTLTTFYCTLSSGEPVLSEHQAATWLEPGDLHVLDWAPADIPAVRKIQSDLMGPA